MRCGFRLARLALFFEQLFYASGEARGGCAVDSAMVVRDRDLHRGPNLGFPFHRQHFIADCSDEHQRRLRSEDDRSSVFHAVCAQVGDRKGRPFEIPRHQLLLARFARKFRRARADRLQIHRLRIVDNRNHEAVRRIDRDAEVDAIVDEHLAVAVARIHARVLAERPHHRGQNQIGHRDLRAAGVERAPPLHRLRHIHPDHLDEMRDLLPALRQVARTDRLDAGELFPPRRSQRGRFRCRRCGRRRRGFRPRTAHVVLRDHPVGPGT